jgi:replicative DNA helicase
MLIKELGYHDLKSHQLNEEQRKALHEKAKELKGIDADILVFDDVRNFNVDRVYAEMVRHTPDICCIDYITQMNSSNKDGASWEKIANTTRELKQTVLTLKTPIIGIAQINRSGFDEGPEINNVAGSINIMQDSDIVFGLFQSIDMKKESRMQIRMLKNRDGIIANADMKWDMETMTIEPWNGFH